MPLTPEQLEICKALFKPLVWEVYQEGFSESSNGYLAFDFNGIDSHYNITNGRSGIFVGGHRDQAKAAAEQHYYETMAENVNWESYNNLVLEIQHNIINMMDAMCISGKCKAYETE